MNLKPKLIIIHAGFHLYKGQWTKLTTQGYKLMYKAVKK